MTSPVGTLLERLNGVRRSGAGRWIALCPAHKDRRPSLSIREGDTGAALAHCFAGCSVSEVAAAVGLDLSDLFPRSLDVSYDINELRKQRRFVSSSTALIARLEVDVLLVHVCLADIAAGKEIRPVDRASAKAAASRLWSSLQEARDVI